MGKNKARHILHGVLDCLPIILIPIFMIYSQNHEINDNTLQVQENKVVDFNQKLENGNFADNSKWIVQGNTTTINITDNECTFTYQTTGTSSGLTYNSFSLFTLDHIYYTKCVVLSNTTFDSYVAIGQSYVYGQTLVQSNQSTTIDYYWKVTNNSGNYRYFEIGNRSANNLLYSYTVSNVCLFDLTQMFGEGNEPTKEEFVQWFNNSYYPYTESEEVVIENYETITYNDTDIMSQSFYCLYNAVDKYFNMGNVFGMKNLYTWFETNIFGGTASPSIYVVWNIVLYEFIMDLLFLLYGLFMFFIDLCKRLMEKPLNSIK